MIDNARIADPKTHYGNARKATRNFFVQRVTGALNIAFLLFFAWLVVSLAGAGRAGMVALLANPFVAIPLALLVVSATVHMRIGMHDVIEDYVSDERTNRLVNTLNDVACVLIAVLALGAIAKIMFWG